MIHTTSLEKINNIIESDEFKEYLKNSRWFQNKNEDINEIKIHDLCEFNNINFLILNVITDSGNYLYYFPMIFNDEYDAVRSVNYAETIIDLFNNNSELKCNKGKIKFIKNGNFKLKNGPFSQINAEQSNSSFIIKNIIVKNYRYLQNGENPDVTMINELIKNGFYNVPEPFGHAFYESECEMIYIVNASRYIENSSDLWSYSLNKIKNMLYNKNISDVNDYINDLSKILGGITGRMHRALYISRERDFLPEISDIKDFEMIIKETIENLRRSNLFDSDFITFFNDRFHKIINDTDIKRIYKFRIHGDYHLGQVLISDKLYIIDFEGEPMRALSERSKKSIPLRDVAGMIRSISYLINSFDFLSNDIDSMEKNSMENFIESYKSSIKDIMDFQNDLIYIFLMQKASYELLYEIRNRPSWVNIPLNYIKKVYSNLRSC
ncbi:hypothetical protein [Picrophilus oshimae]|uniref:Predicted trehalose synthase n=1 Tax=Picrophilus torridus (strain ATCC 700027 / DSM 9790 / JCM 10055 / NBRC 100828 / KAW 2/3) TaxID=1122961 RepID=A0A8G2FXT0_PICTO|nr:hypothetical protein [Picrophilus oshimae]SMD31449.1 Predicted trehalose synthase [Picrophilus oshimae DSM 9789]